MKNIPSEILFSALRTNVRRGSTRAKLRRQYTEQIRSYERIVRNRDEIIKTFAASEISKLSPHFEDVEFVRAPTPDDGEAIRVHLMTLDDVKETIAIGKSITGTV